jgi:hypothetical protein
MHVNFIVKLRSIAEKRADAPTWPLCAKDRIRESFRGAKSLRAKNPKHLHAPQSIRIEGSKHPIQAGVNFYSLESK